MDKEPKKNEQKDKCDLCQLPRETARWSILEPLSPHRSVHLCCHCWMGIATADMTHKKRLISIIDNLPNLEEVV